MAGAASDFFRGGIAGWVGVLRCVWRFWRRNGEGGSREIEGGILDAHSVIDETGDPCAVN